MLLCSLCLLATGCTLADKNADAARQFYEHFTTERYHESAFRNDMLDMADSLRTILVIAVDEEQSIDEQQRVILRELEVLNALAAVVDEDGQVYSYTQRNPYMGSFLHDIGMAKEFAGAAPPDFEPARRLINSCLFCHKSL